MPVDTYAAILISAVLKLRQVHGGFTNYCEEDEIKQDSRSIMHICTAAVHSYFLHFKNDATLSYTIHDSWQCTYTEKKRMLP